MAQRKRFRIVDFSGGLNLDQDAALIQDNEATEILNFRLDRMGSLVSRQGYIKFNDADPTGNLVAIGRWRDDSSPPEYHILGATDDGEIIHFDDDAGTADVLYSGLSSREGMFLPVQDYLVYVNGEDDPLVYDGDEVAPLSIEPPAAAPTVAVDTAESGLTGAYKYKYTYFNADTGWESNPSPESDQVNPLDDGVDITYVESDHPWVTDIRIWRTLDDGAVYLLLATVPNANDTYTDTTEDADLATLAVNSNNHPALAYENVAYHAGFMFGSIGDRLYWSRPLNIAGWPTLQQTRVPFDGNDKIVALHSYQDTLIIFGSNNTILLAGQGGAWSLNRQDVEIGCASRKAIVEIEGALIFLSHTGIHSFPDFGRFAPKLERVICGGSSACRTSAAAVYVPEERSIWFSLDDRTYVVHLPNQAITVYDFYAHQYIQGGTEGYSLPLWIGAESSGALPRDAIFYYGGNSDLGADITSRWRSKIYQLDNPEHFKFLRRVGVYGSTGAPASVSFHIADQDVSYPVVVESQADLEQTLWDNFNWDAANWSVETLGYFIGALPGFLLAGRVFQLTIQTQSDSLTSFVPPISLEYRESDRFLG